jgi:molecular chaperone HtpG
MERIMKA